MNQIIMLNLTQKTAGSVSESDPRIVEAERKLRADFERFYASQAAIDNAKAAEEQAHSLYQKLLTDPATRHGAADVAKAEAEADDAYGAAREAAKRREAEHAALVGEIGGLPDLQARANELTEQARLRDAERYRSSYRKLDEELQPLLLRVEAIERTKHELHKAALTKWPEDAGAIGRGAGIVPTEFPAGIFIKSAPLDGHIAKSVYRDDVLKAVFTAYPEMIPADQAGEIRDAIETDCKRGVTTIAGRVAWHIQQIFSVRGPALFRGRARLDVRDL